MERKLLAEALRAKLAAAEADVELPAADPAADPAAAGLFCRTKSPPFQQVVRSSYQRSNSFASLHKSQEERPAAC